MKNSSSGQSKEEKLGWMTGFEFHRHGTTTFLTGDGGRAFQEAVGRCVWNGKQSMDPSAEHVKGYGGGLPGCDNETRPVAKDHTFEIARRLRKAMYLNFYRGFKGFDGISDPRVEVVSFRPGSPKSEITA